MTDKEALKEYLRNWPASLVELAEEGRREPALDVLSEFCNAVEMDHVPHEEVLRYLSRAFRKILDGDKPVDALNLKGPKHRPASDHAAERRILVAREVVRRMANGSTQEQAIEATRKHQHVSRSTVEKALDHGGRQLAKWIENIDQ